MHLANPVERPEEQAGIRLGGHRPIQQPGNAIDLSPDIGVGAINHGLLVRMETELFANQPQLYHQASGFEASDLDALIPEPGNDAAAPAELRLWLNSSLIWAHSATSKQRRRALNRA